MGDYLLHQGPSCNHPHLNCSFADDLLTNVPKGEGGLNWDPGQWSTESPSENGSKKQHTASGPSFYLPNEMLVIRHPLVPEAGRIVAAKYITYVASSLVGWIWKQR